VGKDTLETKVHRTNFAQLLKDGVIDLATGSLALITSSIIFYTCFTVDNHLSNEEIPVYAPPIAQEQPPRIDILADTYTLKK
jgi:hypothetical protein